MKQFLVVVLISVIIASPAMATDTAVKSMSLPTWATNDESLTYTLFPQLLPEFTNRFVLEYGGMGVRSYLNVNLFNGTALIGANMPFSGNVQTGNNQFMIGYGFKSNIGKIGIAFAMGPNLHSTTSLATDVPKTKGGNEYYNSSGSYQLLLGLSKKIIVPMDISLLVTYPYNTVTEATEVDQNNGKELRYAIERKSGLGIHLEARAKLSKDALVGAGIGFEYAGYINEEKNWAPPNYNLQNENKITTSDYKFILGTGGTYVWHPNKRIMIKPALLGQLILDFYKQKNYVYVIGTTKNTTTPDDHWSLGLNLVGYFGGEALIYKSWKFRAGISKNLLYLEYKKTQSLNQNDKVTSGKSETLVNSNALTFTTGIGGKIGFVNIDLLLNTNFFLNGPYLLSGVPSTFATQVAFSIVW